MGLDMYLSARKVVDSTQTSDVEIIDDVMYWRKANAIHRWFVENVQGCQDDCCEYPVSRDQLETLLSTISERQLERGVPDIALEEESRLLPTGGGFFFGHLEFDDYYWSELERTERVLSSVLSSTKYEGWDFYYQANW